MPAKNSVKEFVANSFYHLYNRGVEKRLIFVDKQDYNVFLSYLKTYLMPKDMITLQAKLASPSIPWKEKNDVIRLIRMNNFSDTIELAAYCLMPNHFHLLVKQTEQTVIDQFMNSLCTRYAMYINRKYHRVGVLFQDVYKAVRVTSDEQLMYLTRYIHRNPGLKGVPLKNFEYSSHRDYIGLRQTKWIKPNEILAYFSKSGFNSYEAFVDSNKDNLVGLESVCIDANDTV